MHYELTYIISAALPENEHAGLQQEINSQLEKIQAKIIKPAYSLGRKKLAYAINKQKHGFYVAVEFGLEEKPGLKDLEIALAHNPNILRHLVINKRPDSPLKPTRRHPADKRVQPRTVAEKPIRRQPAKPTQPSKPVNINLEELDKKLDQILED